MSRLPNNTFIPKVEGPEPPLVSDFQSSAFVDLIEHMK
jgi:hypothetical protein